MTLEQQGGLVLLFFFNSYLISLLFKITLCASFNTELICWSHHNPTCFQLFSLKKAPKQHRNVLSTWLLLFNFCAGLERAHDIPQVLLAFCLGFHFTRSASYLNMLNLSLWCAYPPKCIKITRLYPGWYHIMWWAWRNPATGRLVT